MSENKAEEHHEIEFYGDPQIASAHGKVPFWLKLNYVFWPLWGLVWFYYFWNGSYGWLDRGYWQQLQRAANTTFPSENFEDMTKNEMQKLEKEKTKRSP